MGSPRRVEERRKVEVEVDEEAVRGRDNMMNGAGVLCLLSVGVLDCRV